MYYLLSVSTFISLPGCGNYQTGNEIDRSDLVDPRGPLNSTISRRLRAFLILPAGLARRNPFERIRISQLLNIPNGLIRVSVYSIYVYIHLIYANVMLESGSNPKSDTPQIVNLKKGSSWTGRDG